MVELLLIDDQVRAAIQERRNATEIREVALRAGMRLLREDGLEKILAGKTTPEEVERVTVRAGV